MPRKRPSSPSKRPVKAKAAATAETFPTQVRIRMYRPGLGECFLLTFPRLGQPFHMLIECGVILGTPNAAQKMKQVVNDIRQATGGRLDLVVATHRHWDKVSGFVQAKDEFDKMKIGSVWLPWIEDPHDADAVKLRRGTGPTPGFNAIENLRKMSRQVLYLRGGDGPLKLESVPGVQVFILGPPSVSPDYDRAKAAFKESQKTAASPFDESYRISSSDAKNQPAFAGYFGGGGSQRSEDWRQIGKKAKLVTPRFRVGFEETLNDSSLVMAIELAGDAGESKVLLFPGDAQTASWLSWYEYVWPATAPPDDPRATTCRKLLQQTVFYKVSHHGSHSGTPLELGLEMMTSPELVAMISVDHAMALNKRWMMPSPDVVAALSEKTRGRVIRSDQGVPATFPAALSTPERQQFSRSVSSKELYIDYVVAIPQLTAAERQKSEAKWTAANDRRVYLVDKKLAGTIKPSEEVELRELEQLMDDYLSTVAPTGIGLLTELRETVDRIKGRAPQK